MPHREIFYPRSYGYDSRKVLHNLTSVKPSENVRFVQRSQLHIVYICLINLRLCQKLSDETVEPIKLRVL